MSNKELIKTQMSGILNLPVESLEDDADLASLVNNSFILIELIIELQEEYNVRFGQSDMQDVNTVGELVNLYLERIDT